MHLCHGADAVDAISPCGAIFLLVCIFVSPLALPLPLPSNALSQMGLNGARNDAEM